MSAPTLRYCRSCGIVLQTGEKVAMEVTGIYRALPSRAVFALQRSSVEYVTETIRHMNCTGEEMDD